VVQCGLKWSEVDWLWEQVVVMGSKGTENDESPRNPVFEVRSLPPSGHVAAVGFAAPGNKG